MSEVKLILGDCLDVLPTLEANSIHSIVTDPPAGIAFMGKSWDKDKGGRDDWIAWMTKVAAECLRLLKPGGHAFVWALPRTSHWTATAWENAGFELRDCVYHIFGSGFPKSKNLGNGFGTALKPAAECWWLLRKPLSEKTIAQNVLAHGTGGINIDACRVAIEDGATMARNNKPGSNGWKNSSGGPNGATLNGEPQGRWPANVIHDGSEEVVGLFPVAPSVGRYTNSLSKPKIANKGVVFTNPNLGSTREQLNKYAGDTGSAARFFYCAKSSRRDRDEGLEGMELRESASTSNGGKPGKVMTVGAASLNGTPTAPSMRRNHHPTVKPTVLMRYLCRLVTPPGGTILDPFCGSGSTGKGAVLEGFSFVGIELEPEYLEIARRRIDAARM